MILTGETNLEDEANKRVPAVTMTPLQRAKTIEILSYIKRQQKRRKAALEYDIKVKEAHAA